MIQKKKNKKMTTATFPKRTENVRIKKIAGKKMAVLPLDVWEERMSQSPRFLAKIRKARAEKKSYSLEEVKKRLGL